MKKENVTDIVTEGTQKSKENPNGKAVVETDDRAMLNWRGDDPEVIAGIIPRGILADRFIFQKKFNVLPGEAALLMSRGRGEGVIEEGQVIRSGLMDRVRRFVGDGEDLVLLMIVTSELVLRVTTGINKVRMLTGDPLFYSKILNTLKPSSVSPRRVFLEEGEKLKDSAEAEERAQGVVEEKENLQRAAQEQAELKAVQEFLDYAGWSKASDDITDTPLVTSDRESVVLDVKLLVNIEPQRAIEIFKLVGGRPGGRLKKQDLQKLIAQELTVRVFAPELQKHTAEELRVNLEIIGHLQQDAEKELFQWLRNYGIRLNRLSINPAVTDQERTALITKEKQALEDLAKGQHERDKAAALREFELLLLRDKNAREFEKAAREHNHEMTRINLGTLLAEKANKLSEQEIHAQIDRIIKDTEIEGKRKERELEQLGIDRNWEREKEKMLTEAKIKIDVKREEAEIEIAGMKAFYEQVQKIEALKHQQQLEIRDDQRKTIGLEIAHIQNLIESAIKAGILNADVVTESIRQASVRKALDQGDATGQAFAQAEGQKYAKENFKEGLTTQPPTGLLTNKQGDVLFLAGQPIPAEMARGSRPILGTRNPGKASEQRTIECPNPNCRRDVPDDSRVCPYCATELIAGEENAQ